MCLITDQMDANYRVEESCGFCLGLSLFVIPFDT